ncbi:MAG: T9SS type A sorting domain-containing protein [Bacteroidia bacterium]
MKKSYTMIIAALAVGFTANAQNRGSVNPTTAHPSPIAIHQLPASERATGDTLMYMPLPGYSINSTDAPAFQLVTEDIDMLSPYNAGYAMSFGDYYSTDSSMAGITPTQNNFYHPWETPAPLGNDTAFFWSATSWFSPAGQADNWLMFGPITVPAGGASIKWEDRTNRYRDGYEVLVMDASSISTPITFSDFASATQVFMVTDDAYPSATWAVDTTWEPLSATVPAALNGMTIAVAFHHTANDMDVLRLDDIRVIEGPAGVAEFDNGVKVYQNSPNPANGSTMITYELANNSQVALNIYDVTGKLIENQNIGSQSAGVHKMNYNAANLAAGVYYYSFNVDSNTTSAKKMVVIK